MSNQEQDFQMMLTKEDYQKLLKWQKLYTKKEKEYENSVEQVKKIAEIVTKQKKTIYQKNQEIKFLRTLINSHLDRISGVSSVPLQVDISKSYYQELADLKAQGFSSIFQKQLVEKFEQSHIDLIKKLSIVETKILSTDSQLSQLKQLYKAEKNNKASQIDNANIKKSKIDSQIIQDLMKEKNILLNRIQILEKDLQNKILQTVTLQKEIQVRKNKTMTSGQRSYQIKLLIDQYYKELQVSLGTIDGLDRKQIQIVVQNQFKGIIQYVNQLMKKTFVTEAKQKK